MSLSDIAISVASAAAAAVIRKMVEPKKVADHLDAVAERLRFDAQGQRRLDERKARR